MNGPSDIATFEERNVRLKGSILTFDAYVHVHGVTSFVGTFHAPADSDTFERAELIKRKWEGRP